MKSRKELKAELWELKREYRRVVSALNLDMEGDAGYFEWEEVHCRIQPGLLERYEYLEKTIRKLTKQLKAQS